MEKIENIMEFITYYKITRRSATQEVILFYDFFFLTHLHLILISGTIFAPIANFLHDVEKHEVRAQSFIALMVDLRHDINRVSSYSRCLNGTFP